ncbi:MAG TPA: alpha/beta hydrolase-fold protein, partial [Roseateles sp.]|nr:alpha/beta hydrolase-fold protein [Roseateles sp.]
MRGRWLAAALALLAAVAPVRALIVERTLASPALGETRRLRIWLPPGHEAGRRYPVVYMADGWAEAGLLLEPAVARGELPPFLIVGLASCSSPVAPPPGQTDCRQHEDMDAPEPDGRPARFAAHERFFLDEVMPLAEREFGAADRP